MEKSIITTGKTIDLAIAAALEQLGMDRDSVSVTVLENAKSGFFGIGAVPAKVQVTYEAPDEKPAAPKVALSSASRSKPKTKPQPKVEAKPEPKVEAKPEPKPGPKPEPKPEPKAEPKPEKPRAPKADKPAKQPREPREPKAEKPKASKVERTYEPAAAGSNEEKIETFIKGLLENMGSQAVPHAWLSEEGVYRVELTGEGLGFLIGRRGETLDAIQHLANYAVNRNVEGHIRINVDAEDYRQKREESLRRYARKKAQQVLKARRRTMLEPMNAYERHVIHASLQDMDNITTHSTGTEPNRRVVIEYVR